MGQLLVAMRTILSGPNVGRARSGDTGQAGVPRHGVASLGHYSSQMRPGPDSAFGRPSRAPAGAAQPF